MNDKCVLYLHVHTHTHSNYDVKMPVRAPVKNQIGAASFSWNANCWAASLESARIIYYSEQLETCLIFISIEFPENFAISCKFTTKIPQLLILSGFQRSGIFSMLLKHNVSWVWAIFDKINCLCCQSITFRAPVNHFRNLFTVKYSHLILTFRNL